jgi:YVTN family beta-propeller protein
LKNALISMVCLLAACGVDETGVDPPTDALWFPLGIGAHPDGRYLYVANAVFDRRFNAGTVVVYDTFARRILPEATVRIGLFAGELVVGRTATDAPVHAYTVSRDDNRLIRFTVDPQATQHLDCDQTGGACAGAAIFDDFGTDGDFAADPFGLSLDGDGLFLTHVGRGVLSRWQEGETGFRFGCSVGMDDGATAVARHPATGHGYVSDRFGQRVSVVEERVPFRRGGAESDPCELRTVASIAVDPSSDRGRTRGLAFSADGSLLYAASSTDSTLRIYDTSVGPTGPRNRLLAVIPLGGTPNLVRVAGLRPGESRLANGLDPGTAGATLDALGGGLVYITLFEEDRVVVVDPTTFSVIAQIDVAGGPHDLVFLPDGAGALRAYVTLFEDHALAVLDVQPDSPRRFSLLATVP